MTDKDVRSYLPRLWSLLLTHFPMMRHSVTTTIPDTSTTTMETISTRGIGSCSTGIVAIRLSVTVLLMNPASVVVASVVGNSSNPEVMGCVVDIVGWVDSVLVSVTVVVSGSGEIAIVVSSKVVGVEAL